MKNIALLLCLIISVSTGFAQKIKVNEGNFNLNGGSHNAMKVMIYEQDASEVEKAWKSEMKKSNAKVSSKGGIVANNAVIKAIGEHPCDVYATFGNSGDGTEMIVGFNLGGAYLSSSEHVDQYKSAEKMVEAFASKQVAEAMKIQVKAAEKLVKDQEKNLEKLEGDKKNLENDIQKYKDGIKKSENDLITNKKDQEDAKAKVGELSKALEAVKAKQAKYN
jgi:hypothetical protein